MLELSELGFFFLVYFGRMENYNTSSTYNSKGTVLYLLAVSVRPVVAWSMARPAEDKPVHLGKR